MIARRSIGALALIAGVALGLMLSGCGTKDCSHGDCTQKQTFDWTVHEASRF